MASCKQSQSIVCGLVALLGNLVPLHLKLGGRQALVHSFTPCISDWSPSVKYQTHGQEHHAWSRMTHMGLEHHLWSCTPCDGQEQYTWSRTTHMVQHTTQGQKHDTWSRTSHPGDHTPMVKRTPRKISAKTLASATDSHLQPVCGVHAPPHGNGHLPPM